MNYQEIPEFENLKNKNGLYLIGNCTFNPYTNEKFYWIKIGTSSDIKNRIKKYRTHNPGLWVIDTFEFKPTKYYYDTLEIEKTYHTFLSTYFEGKAIAKNSREWYQISEKNYIEICQQGFSIFDKYDKDFKRKVKI